MLDKLLKILSRLLHPSQLEIDPGRFEAFLTPVPEPARIDCAQRRIERSRRAA